MQDNVSLWYAKDNNGDVVLIEDAKKGEKYFCPICMSEVIPRGINENSQVSPHYAHIDKSKCTSESIIHWWVKNEFIKRDESFVVNINGANFEYVCKEVYIEKEVLTSNGVYVPDISILTKNNKTIYIEIFNTNKKDIEYYWKYWDELKCTVVEVDVKNIVNSNKTNKCFKSIYYDGMILLPKGEKSAYDKVVRNIRNTFENSKINNEEILDNILWLIDDLYRYNSGEIDIEDLYVRINCIDDKFKHYIVDVLKRNTCSTVTEDYLKLKNKYIQDSVEDVIGRKVIDYTIKDCKNWYDRIYSFGFKYIRVEFKNRYIGLENIICNKDNIIEFIVKNSIPAIYYNKLNISVKKGSVKVNSFGDILQLEIPYTYHSRSLGRMNGSIKIDINVDDFDIETIEDVILDKIHNIKNIKNTYDIDEKIKGYATVFIDNSESTYKEKGSYILSTSYDRKEYKYRNQKDLKLILDNIYSNSKKIENFRDRVREKSNRTIPICSITLKNDIVYVDIDSKIYTIKFKYINTEKSINYISKKINMIKHECKNISLNDRLAKYKNKKKKEIAKEKRRNAKLRKEKINNNIINNIHFGYINNKLNKRFNTNCFDVGMSSDLEDIVVNIGGICKPLFYIEIDRKYALSDKYSFNKYIYNEIEKELDYLVFPKNIHELLYYLKQITKKYNEYVYKNSYKKVSYKWVYGDDFCLCFDFINIKNNDIIGRIKIYNDVIDVYKSDDKNCYSDEFKFKGIDNFKNIMNKVTSDYARGLRYNKL